MATASVWTEDLQNLVGDRVAAATVTIYNEDGVTPAVLYTDSDALITMPNPLTTGVSVGGYGLDTAGNVKFRAIAGEYVIAVVVSGTEVYRAARTIFGFVTPIVVTSGAEYNVMDFMDHPNAGEGNPAVDDTQGFVDCFAAAAASGPTGARVRVPGGVYYIEPHDILFPSFIELDCELGCTWLIRKKGSAGAYGLRTGGFIGGTPAYEVHIRGLTYDGNYVKFYDGVNAAQNPDADIWGGPGGAGLSLYGEHVSLESVRVKNCKGTGMDLRGSHTFGAGATNTGHQWDVRDIHVVNCYGTYALFLGIVDSLVDGFQVINWDDEPTHLITPGAPYPTSPVGQVGVVLASGGIKLEHGHVWAANIWRGLYDFAGGSVVDTVTLDTCRDAGLWMYGAYSQFRNMDIYSLTPTLGATRKGVIVGDAGKDVWGCTFDGHIRDCRAGAVEWVNATRGNRFTGTIINTQPGTELIGDPSSGPEGGPSNVVDLITMEP